VKVVCKRAMSSTWPANGMRRLAVAHRSFSGQLLQSRATLSGKPWLSRSVSLQWGRKPPLPRGLKPPEEEVAAQRMVALCYSAAPRNFDFEKSQLALQHAFGRGSHVYFDEVCRFPRSSLESNDADHSPLDETMHLH